MDPLASRSPELFRRDDYRAFAVRFWRGVKPAFRTLGHRVRLGQQTGSPGIRAENMESYSRILWALGPLHAGGEATPEVDWGLLRSILMDGTGPH